MIMRWISFLLLWLLTASRLLSQEDPTIQKILQNDLLDASAQDQFDQFQAAKRQQKERLKQRYLFPPASEFWNIFSEYWLVKRMTFLKWDYPTAHLGLESTLHQTFQQIDLPYQSFKILLVQTTDIGHIALPSSLNQPIFILSEPFLRAAGLSTEEAVALLITDWLRLKQKRFETYVSTRKLRKLLGTNFYPSSLDRRVMEKSLKRYDDFMNKKRFSYQDQFFVIKSLKARTQKHPKILKALVSGLRKIKRLTNINLVYQSYKRLYPLLESQIYWANGLADG